VELYLHSSNTLPGKRSLGERNNVRICPPKVMKIDYVVNWCSQISNGGDRNSGSSVTGNFAARIPIDLYHS
jgi:hypothetical protein